LIERGRVSTVGSYTPSTRTPRVPTRAQPQHHHNSESQLDTDDDSYRNLEWNEKENIFQKVLSDKADVLSDSHLKHIGSRYTSSLCGNIREDESGSYVKCSEIAETYCHQCEGMFKTAYASLFQLNNVKIAQ
jgi:hypothetical protein